MWFEISQFLLFSSTLWKAYAYYDVKMYNNWFTTYSIEETLIWMYCENEDEDTKFSFLLFIMSFVWFVKKCFLMSFWPSTKRRFLKCIKQKARNKIFKNLTAKIFLKYKRGRKFCVYIGLHSKISIKTLNIGYFKLQICLSENY